MTDAMTTAAAVEPRVSADISLEAPELDLLLVDWLSELLFRFETTGFLVGRAVVELVAADVFRLGARVEGEPFDAARHPVKVLLKAVTYHGLEITEDAGRWTATVIFDI
jgi:SHS2 domain-containing protein